MIKPLVLVFTLMLLGAQASYAQMCITSSTSGDQITGTQDGFRHELWNQDKQGTACMTLGTRAAFTAQWSGIQNYLARRGLGYDQTQKHEQIGTFNATYNVTYSPNCSSGNSYMGVYGWTFDSTQSAPNDLVEWYIIDNWCNWNPSMDANAQNMGTIWLGGEYDVIRVRRNNAPSIKGTRDFMQYFSIRKQVRTEGSMNISEHFYNWENLGMRMGNMHEVSMLVEGYQNSGTATFNSLDVYRTNNTYATAIRLSQDAYTLTVGEQTSRLEIIRTPTDSTMSNFKVVSSNTNVVDIGVYKGNIFLIGKGAGTATITLTSLTAPRPGQAPDTATVTVTQAANSLIAQN